MTQPDRFVPAREPRQFEVRTLGELDELAHDLLFEAERRLWRGRAIVEIGLAVGAEGRERIHFGRGTLTPEEQRDELVRAARRVAATRTAWLRVMGRSAAHGRRMLVAVAEEGEAIVAWGFEVEIGEGAMRAGAWERIDAGRISIAAQRILGPAA